MQIGFMYRSLLILPLSFITWMSRKVIFAHLGVVNQFKMIRQSGEMGVAFI